MPRSRNIKPGFFVNEQLVELPFSTRLLFIGLWTLADREGRLDDRPRKIKMSIFPSDDVNIDEALTDLHDANLICRYTAEEMPYIQIINFVKHQQPHYKEVASIIPPPDGHTDSGVVAFGVSESRRQAIFDRDGRKCLECGRTEKLSLDHITPRSLGGSDEDSNLQTLCSRCNASKNNRDAVRSMSSQRQVNVAQSSARQAVLNPSSLNPSSLNPSSLKDESPTSTSDDVKTVFRAWQKELDHTKAKCDKKRSDIIKARLKDFSVDELCLVPVGVKKSSFHMGDNLQQTKYDGIETIFKSVAQVEKFLALAQNGDGQKSQDGCDVCRNDPNRSMITLKTYGWIFDPVTHELHDCVCKNGSAQR